MDRFPEKKKEAGVEKSQAGQRRPAGNEVACAA